jgi:hypothetical protein
VLQGLGAFGVGMAGLGGYALGFEPMRHRVTRYALTPPGWTPGLRLRLAVIADVHACKPWMSADRIADIAATANALEPDATLLLGDYMAGKRLSGFSNPVAPADWAAALATLKAPLGVHAILGNHDFWEDANIQHTRQGMPEAHKALLAAGIPVYENDALRLEKNGKPFWLVGLGEQWAFWRRRQPPDFRFAGYDGRDDLAGMLAKVTDAAPVIAMVHEPDIFPRMPGRVSLTLAGHTHGGQVRIAGFAPIVPSYYGRRYTYGHIVEQDRHIIVSGGLGCSGLPVRFGSPPEIVLVDLA